MSGAIGIEKNDLKRMQAVEGLLQAQPDRDFLIISHPINRALHYKLTGLLQQKQKHKACTLFLTTGGGDPNGGYRAARCLRHYYKHVRLVVPSFCKSAGTLIAIAADELAIGDLGELGPLDIQVRKGSELQERSSGLDIMQAVQAVTVQTQDAFHRIMVGTRNLGLSTRLCAEFAASVAAGISAPLMNQIDPIRLGEMQRATRVALEYGQRLNSYANNLKEDALEALISAYPSHGFVIDRKEAAELFQRVSPLLESEQNFCNAFWDVVAIEHNDYDPIIVEPPSQTKMDNKHDDSENVDNLEEQKNCDQRTGSDTTKDGSDCTGSAEAAGSSIPVRQNGRSVRKKEDKAIS